MINRYLILFLQLLYRAGDIEDCIFSLLSLSIYSYLLPQVALQVFKNHVEEKSKVGCYVEARDPKKAIRGVKLNFMTLIEICQSDVAVEIQRYQELVEERQNVLGMVIVGLKTYQIELSELRQLEEQHYLNAWEVSHPDQDYHCNNGTQLVYCCESQSRKLLGLQFLSQRPKHLLIFLDLIFILQ